MSIMLPYGRCFQGSIDTNPLPPDPPDGPQIITSRNFGIGWGAVNNQTGDMANRSSVFNEMQTYNFRNLRVKYDWPKMETNTSTAATPAYDWTRLDDDFDDMITVNNITGRDAHIIILMQMQDDALDPAEHGINDNVVPKFMRPYHTTTNPIGDVGSATYGGGQWEYEKGNSPGEFGYRIMGWNDNVKAMMIRFVTAMLEHIKSIPAYDAIFEGIGYTESSIDGAIPPVVVNKNKQFSNLREVLAAARLAAPTKMVYGSYNGPRDQLYAAYNFLPTIQGAAWGPDVFPDKSDYFLQDTVAPITQKGHYTYYLERTDIVKFLDVQPQDYRKTVPPAYTPQSDGHYPTLQELYDFSLTLGCNYLIWFRHSGASAIEAGESLENYQRVLNWMNTNGSPQKTLAHGGMNTTAPPPYDP